MPTETGSPFRRDVADAVLRLPAAAALGLTFTVLGDGRAEAMLPWRAEHSHAPGAFQAGPIATLADLAGAAAAVTLLPAGSRVTTTDLTVKYLAEARGEALLARARVLHCGRGSSAVSVDLRVDDSEPCAAALIGVKNLRSDSGPT